MIGVGIVGAGGIGVVHAESYGRLEGVKIVGIADVDAGRGQKLADQVGARYYATVSALVANADVQAVSICLPHALHAEATIAAAAAGKHVLCEKPIATTLDDADRMIRACRDAGVKLMIGQTHRFRPEHLEARRLLDEGTIGQVLFVNDLIWWAREGDESLQWRGEIAMNGGGIFMDNGVHAADRLRWWLRSEVTSVTARIGRGRGLIEGEENGTALLGFANGATAVLQQALGTPASASCCYVEFVGTHGVVRVDTWQGLKISLRGKPWETVEYPKDGLGGFDLELFEFVSAIRENREPAVTGEDGRAAFAIIGAIYESARKRTTVELEPRLVVAS
ncbi:MAG TPA: Gfo/Idh/MocA family oxidoreductase [Chloroflexota bacterium]|nr:Gfo/Idh/MocA family oxidoreductase [Chloroflexota bacterium]